MYITYTHLLENDKVFDEIYRSVPRYRKEKVNAYRFIKDKRLSLAAGYLLSYALKKRGLNESELICSVTENGHPYFVNAENLHFSLSHSGEMAMCIISDTPVGCDVEILAGNEDMDLKRWTAMESYLKATDGVLDELLDFEPSDVTGYKISELNVGEKYKSSVCVVEGTDVEVHFLNRLWMIYHTDMSMDRIF